MNGRNNRTSHSGVLRLDAHPTSSEVSVLPLQDWISVHTGTGCVSGAVLVYDDRRILTDPPNQN
jgi:hypothetical protein